MKLLSSNIEEDRAAEKNLMSQANQQADVFAKALSAAPSGFVAAPGTFIGGDSRVQIGLGGNGGGGVSCIGSGTAGLDYPRPPSVSTMKCASVVGGSVDATVGRGSGGEKEAAVARVRGLFAALKTVGKSEGGAKVMVPTMPGVPSRGGGVVADGATGGGGGGSAGGGGGATGNERCREGFADAGGPKAPTVVCADASAVPSSTVNIAPAAAGGGPAEHETNPSDDSGKLQVRNRPKLMTARGKILHLLYASISCNGFSWKWPMMARARVFSPTV